ncbi:MAG: efflux RND transporter periplasmic adaptor subunit [Coriobacteriales bacterium]|nr:efflux RND transporter periplasmic adaptor subunit [Coriobacteriales bacterium]
MGTSEQGRVRRGKRPLVVVGVILGALVVAVGIFLLVRFLPTTAVAQQDGTVLSTQVSRGNITTTVVGSGNVEDHLIDLTTLTGITIAELNVAVGDTIEVGQLLATVDTSSLSSAITAVSDELSAVQEQLDALSDGTTETTAVTAKSLATVKTIYATEGASAADVIAEQGALMVLELDGGGEMLVTDRVGTISTIWVCEGWTVYSGSWLLSLELPVATQSSEELEVQRAALITELEALSALASEPYLYADQAGTISSLALVEGQTFNSTDGVAAELISPDVAQISLSIDELDIASVQEGQEVSIELDALEGVSFAGSVAEVSTTGSVSGSVASYTAVVTFERAAGALTGMSATATIIKEQKEDALTIPLVAVQEYGDVVYVYTTLDEQGVLGGEIQIETGLSDGTNVEVTSGLEEGAVVYYRQQSSTDTGVFSMGMGMGGERTMSSGGGFGGQGVPTGGAGPSLSAAPQ